MLCDCRLAALLGEMSSLGISDFVQAARKGEIRALQLPEEGEIVLETKAAEQKDTEQVSSARSSMLQLLSCSGVNPTLPRGRGGRTMDEEVGDSAHRVGILCSNTCTIHQQSLFQKPAASTTTFRGAERAEVLSTRPGPAQRTTLIRVTYVHICNCNHGVAPAAMRSKCRACDRQPQCPTLRTHRTGCTGIH